MPGKRRIHHPNDVTNRYFSELIPKILHRHFRLPGKFVRNYTTRIIKQDGSEGEMDWLLLVEPDNCRLFERILINVEFQSSAVTKEKIKIISEYKDYAKTYYGLPVLSVIIITDGYESSEMEYSIVPSDILKPIYIHISWEEIIERLKKLEEKIDNHYALTEDDGLDMVYLPMFSPRDEAEDVLERILQLFGADKSLKGSFRNYVAFGLSIMIKKYFGPTTKTEELLEMLKENVENDRLRMVAEFEADFERQLFERKLADKEKEFEAINSQNEAMLSEKDDMLSQMDDMLSQKDDLLSEKDEEIKALKAKLEANGISY